MWEVRVAPVPSGLRYQIFRAESPLSFRETFALLEASRPFARWYTDTIAAAPFAAFFWENPPFDSTRFDESAEFVLIESVSLARLNANPGPFERQFSSHPEPLVATFENLGGDALLVVPRPIANHTAYAHLAAFVRHAPDHQVRALWQTAARTVRENLGSTPRWLSTAGLGVSWLHIRLDTRPKYYQHVPYANAA